MKLRALALACVLVIPAGALAQALTSLSSVRVSYTTRKNTVKPEGELKAAIDALDQQIAEATRLGRTGELRRLFAKGLALLSGREWTDAAEYASSLVIRTEQVVTDSSKRFSARLEQISLPSMRRERARQAHVLLRERPAPRPPNQNAPAQPPRIVKDLGTFDGVGRDLRESPFAFDLDVHDVADGTYLLSAEIADTLNALGVATLAVTLRNGL